MKLSELLVEVRPQRIQGSLDLEIRGLAYDSRNAAEGALFFALPGTTTDGNRYIQQAIEAGSVAVVSQLPPPPPPFSLTKVGAPEQPITWIQVSHPHSAMSAIGCRFYGHPSSGMTVIAATGTNGKTSTTYLLESIFTKAGLATGVLGTVNYRLRGREIERASNTTPLSIDLHRLLHRLRTAGATHAVMEISSHALALQRAEHVDFDAAIFLNIHRDHLDYHKTHEAYFEAKAHLFDILCRLGNSKKRPLAVLNIDDPHSLQLRRRVTNGQVLTFGVAAQADVQASGITAGPEGTSFRMRYRDRQWRVRLQLIGDYNVSNALAAAAAALGLGISDRAIVAGLEGLVSVPGRLESVQAGQAYPVFVDYAHTDSALEGVLRCLQKLPHHRILTVFGCGGDRDQTKRGPMGIAAATLSDFVVLTSDNPRSEDPMKILYQIEAGIRSVDKENYKIVPDRREAIAECVRLAQAGDILLIAGKGHETGQILRDRILPFDDRAVARELIQRAGS